MVADTPRKRRSGMGKKKHPEHVNHERWLVSYADFITLLFAFFVVLFASGQSDKKKSQKMAAAMQAAFSDSRIFDMHSATPPLTEGGAGESKPVAMPLATAPDFGKPDGKGGDGNGEKTPEQIAARVREAVQQAIAQQKLPAKGRDIPGGVISVHQSADGITVSLQEAGFFTSGSASVWPASAEALRTIIAALPRTMKIRVEGHSDNIPIHTAQFASNWELSSARSSAIARAILEQSDIDPGLLSAAGYAEFHPIATNATPEGRAQNRRVDIVILKPVAPPAPPQAPPAAEAPEAAH